MTITVVIPVLNEEQTIVATLRHTASLDVNEIVVVDGGSTDQTRAEAEARGLARVLTSQPGRARQLNAGAKASRSEILLFLHADTRLPDRARQSIESALADPAVVGGRFDVRFDSHSAWSRIISTFMNLRSRLTRISTGDQAMFVRRHIFEQLGGFSDIPLMEDIEFSTRLKRTGPTRALHDTVTTSFRRWEQQGPLRTVLLMWTLRLLYWIGVSPHRLTRFYTVIR
ncbi:MAG TPA: TIGR04283 family arsenosugar biosynthesis glycosyltransferase [Nitrospira sp.]|nr:TIGR04283 family arsenosugar biosynthesis glycosyltransferase [Nitrospira sp.]